MISLELNLLMLKPKPMLAWLTSIGLSVMISLGSAQANETAVPKYIQQVASHKGADGRALFALALVNCRQQVGSYWVAWPWAIYQNGIAIKLKSQLELIRYIQNDPDVAFGLYALTLSDFAKNGYDVSDLLLLTTPKTQVNIVANHFDAASNAWLNEVASRFNVIGLATKKPITLPKSVTNLDKIIHHNAKKYGVSVALIKAVIRAESAYNPNAVSSAGAMGLMQVMPSTAKSLGVSNPKRLFNPQVAVATGTKYLSMQLKQFKSVPLALAAYNAGPGAVRKYGYNIPPYKETKNYVRKVQRYLRHYQRQGGV